MTTAVMFGPVTSAVIGYLSTRLGVPCSMQVPNPRPPSWVRVLRTGGAQTDIVTEDAQLTIEAWADDAVAAEDVANAARYHLQMLRNSAYGGIAIYRIDELAGPAYLPDPDSHQPRWTFSVIARVRGVTPA